MSFHMTQLFRSSDSLSESGSLSVDESIDDLLLLSKRIGINFKMVNKKEN